MGGLPIQYLSDIYGFSSEKPNLLRVLTYHRIGHPDETPHLEPRQISASTENFAAQMAFLRQNYRVLSMPEVLEHIESGRQLPDRSVLITFDDACLDVKSNAHPVLKKLNLTATVFVPTAYPGHPERAFWWDDLYRAVVLTDRRSYPNSPIGSLSLDSLENRLQHLKSLQNYVKTLSHDELLETVLRIAGDLGNKPKAVKTVLDWDELRELAGEGVLNFGAHTRTHPILTQATLSQAHDEISGSLYDLRREIPESLPVFAYPNGNCSPEILEIMHEEGYQLAFTTEDGINNLNTANPLLLRRINITRRTSLKLFRLRLQRWFSAVDVYRHQ